MYVILDKNLNRVGMLDANGGFGSCPFWGDEINVQIADQDSDVTLDDQSESFNTVDPHANTKNWNHTMPSIYVPYGYPESEEIVQGAHLAYQDNTNNHWYVMRLTDIKDVIDPSGTHYKSCVGVNLAIWDLIHTKLDDLSDPMANCEDAFKALLAKTSWTVGSVDNTGGTAAITFSKSENAQAKLQTLCQIYDCEVDAYIEFDSAGQPTTKVIDIMHELGVDDGTPVNYGDELISMERLSTDTNLFTRLYPYNSKGDGIEDVNDGISYVENETANDEYSTRIVGVDGPKYLEGAITSKSIDNHGALRDWAKGVLGKFDHPRINYSIQIGSDFTAGLGDHIRIKDMEMLPKAAVDARVIQKTFSQADPTQDQVIVGEFATVKVVTPNLISQLQDQLNSKIESLLEDIKNGKKVATVDLITPSGTTWSEDEKQKIIDVQVFVDSTNVTSYLSAAAFRWTKTNQTSGVHDSVWETKHESDGYEVVLDNGDVGTVTCHIEGDYIKDEAELTLAFDNTLIWSQKRVDAQADFWGDKTRSAGQFIWVDETNDQVIASSAYVGSQQSPGSVTDTEFVRYDMNAKIIDAVVVQGGGHGSSFGCHLVNGVPEIWTNIKDLDNKNAYVGKFTWQPNKVISLDKGVTRVCTLPGTRRIAVDFENGWMVTTNMAGNIDVAKISDCEGGDWVSTYTMKMQDFGVKPLPSGVTNDGTYNTSQSNDISFPYVVFNSGVGAVEPRLVTCINVVTHSMVFQRTNVASEFGSDLLDQTHDFEPETVALYLHDSVPTLLQGFNYEKSENNVIYLYRGLWKTTLTVRDDSGDTVNYLESDDDVIDDSEGGDVQ